VFFKFLPLVLWRYAVVDGHSLVQEGRRIIENVLINSSPCTGHEMKRPHCHGWLKRGLVGAEMTDQLWKGQGQSPPGVGRRLNWRKSMRKHFWLHAASLTG